MRIKTQIIALVSGVVLPLALLAGFVTYELGSQQRQGYQQQKDQFLAMMARGARAFRPR